MLTVEFSGAFPRSVSRPLLVRLARKAFAMGGGKGNAVVTVAAVGDAKMKTLNRRYRGKNKVTDILSFGYTPPFPLARSPARPLARSPLGDLIICLPQVRRQAKKIGRAFQDEMALMVVHGVLHLLGYDHESLADERRMFGLQHEILLRARIL